MDLNTIINEDIDLDELAPYIEECLDGEIPYHIFEITPFVGHIVVSVIDDEGETMAASYVNYNSGTTIGKLITYLINNAE